MTIGRLLAVLALVFGIGLAAPAFAEDEDEKGRRGRAAERRSESADENSNAQWSDDAKRGQDRAEGRRGSRDRDDDYDDDADDDRDEKRRWSREQRENWKQKKAKREKDD